MIIVYGERKEMPIFVKIDEYKDILDIIDLIKVKVHEAETIIARINEMKKEEDIELTEWRKEIGDVEKKVDFIDRTLFNIGKN